MPILARNKIEAIDYSQLAGSAASNRPFASEQAAINRLSAIFGVGWGDRGYGQATPILPSVVPGSVVAGSDWQNLLTVIQTCSNYLGTAVNNPPLTSFYNQSARITANNFDWAGTIAQIDSARLMPLSSNLVAVPGVSNSRTEPWTEKPQLTVEVDFGTEDSARWFFNSGGKLVINSTFVPSLSNPQTLSWQTLLNNDAGTISIGAFECSREGGVSNRGIFNSTVGYYNLQDNAQTVFSISPSAAPFSVNSYSVVVQRASYEGRNGGNGSKIIVSLFYDDQYGTPSQPVLGTLTGTINFIKAGNHLTIANPVFNILQILSGGGGQLFFDFSTTISNTVLNYNLLSAVTTAAAASPEPVDLSIVPVRATIIVSNTGVLGSNSTQAPALEIPGNFLAGSTVRIINNGYIVGKGGNGGAGWSWWPPDNRNGGDGGIALFLNWPTTLQNYGIIGGGGGGGGGSSTLQSGQTYDDPGGSGGGGAGSEVGQPGNVGPAASYFGQPGTLTAGGAGGFASPNGRSREWSAGQTGGAGGSLGQNGSAGSGQYGSSVGGSAGAAIVNSNLLIPNSLVGTVLGSVQ